MPTDDPSSPIPRADLERATPRPSPLDTIESQIEVATHLADAIRLTRDAWPDGEIQRELTEALASALRAKSDLEYVFELTRRAEGGR